MELRAVPESVLAAKISDLRTRGDGVRESIQRKRRELREVRHELRVLEGLLEHTVSLSVQDAPRDEVRAAGQAGGGAKRVMEPLLDLVRDRPGLSRDQIVDALAPTLGSSRRSLVTTVWRLLREGQLVERDEAIFHPDDAPPEDAMGPIGDEDDYQPAFTGGSEPPRDRFNDFLPPAFEDDDDLPF